MGRRASAIACAPAKLSFNKMSTPTFTAGDLNVSQEFLDEVEAALTNTASGTPIEDVIAQCADRVTDYTARYELQESRFRRLVRALALEALHGLINAVPEGIKASADDARKEIADIRDGKFPTLLAATAPNIAIQPAPGNWGGGTKIKARI